MIKLSLKILLMGLLASNVCLAKGPKGTWVLKSGSASFHVEHPMHNTDGISKNLKGKGACQNEKCEFLIAAPINSFDSGNANRDTHMLQVLGGAKNPMLIVRVTAKNVEENGKFPATVTISLNGNEVTKNLELNTTKQGSAVSTKGTLALKLTEFKIERPSLLGISVKDEFSVDYQLSWE